MHSDGAQSITISPDELDASCEMLCFDLCIRILLGCGGKLVLDGCLACPFWVNPHLKSLAVIECGFGHCLVSGIGPVSAGRIDASKNLQVLERAMEFW